MLSDLQGRQILPKSIRIEAMADKVPRRNVGRSLADVKKPPKDKSEARLQAVNLTHIPRGRRDFSSVKKFLKRGGLVLLVLAVLMVLFSFTKLGEARKMLSESARLLVQNFSLSAGSIKELKTEEAISSLQQNEEELGTIDKFMRELGGKGFLNAIGSVVPYVRQGIGLFGEVAALNQKFLTLAQEIDALERNAIKNFQSDGGALIASLERVQTLTRELTDQIQRTQNSASSFKGVFGGTDALFGGDYLSYSTELIRTEKFINALLVLLKEPGEKHFVVLFQNAGEARPGGAFAGSYADVTVEGGRLKNIEVRDIYDPDGQLLLNFVPPAELKTMTRKWGARDANWFFDTPTSASTTLFFLENSKIYSEKGTKFEGIIGMNTYVFEDILDVTGPIPVEEYSAVITKENFYKIIRTEVEEGRDKELGDPKKILKVMAPLMLERIKMLTKEDMDKLTEKLLAHLEQKDILVYAKNADIASFLTAQGVDGAVYPLPSQFFGSYLAVVDANVAGGKTDVVMEQSVDARIDLDTNAGLFTDLVVTRKHTGSKTSEAWWSVPNQNFIQVFTNPGMSLVSLKGSSIKTNVSRFDYDKAGYLRIPALQEIENSKVFLNSYQTWTYSAFGKTVFGTWFNVSPGETRVLEARFQLPATQERSVKEGDVYTFIFERQSGVRSKLKVTISAPLGYSFRESQGPLYILEDDTNIGRIVVPLTLVK